MEFVALLPVMWMENVYTPVSSKVKGPATDRLALTLPPTSYWGFNSGDKGPKKGSWLKFAAAPTTIGARGSQGEVLNSQRLSSVSRSRRALRRIFSAGSGFLLFRLRPLADSQNFHNMAVALRSRS